MTMALPTFPIWHLAWALLGSLALLSLAVAASDVIAAARRRWGGADNTNKEGGLIWETPAIVEKF